MVVAREAGQQPGGLLKHIRSGLRRDRFRMNLGTMVQLLEWLIRWVVASIHWSRKSRD
jgi:hypothetical protein